ncbi:MAG TPA: efflux RND transporter periplasmic adaptor subunit [Steroidobacteraceae bacterium]|nr:efflux RND transporter periplasmic adaptor subunit [Steroidobacteraceae bacterium]
MGTDRAALLNQLRIDRSEPPASSGHGKWWAAAIVVIIIAIFAAWYLMRPAGVPITTAVAQAVAGAGAAPGTSLLDASGYIVARRRATVSSKVTGKVMKVMLDEGQRVEAGQVIALLDDANWRAALAQSRAQLEQAQATVDSARTAFDDAKPIFERSEKQKAAAVISAESFDESHAQFNAAHNNLLIAQSGLDAARAGVEVAQRNLDDTVIRAPFAGVVTEKAAQPGEMVSPISAGGGFTRTGIGTIVDMDSLEVEVDVSENFINRVRPQQPVTIKLNAYPDWNIPGSVIAMIPTADRAKATVKVRIAIQQKDPRIIPEMGARVAFLGGIEPGAAEADHDAVRAVIVPADAITGSGTASIVYLVHDSTVERRAVRLGAKASSGQIVIAGLEAGNTVALGDLAKLSDGARVRIETVKEHQ